MDSSIANIWQRRHLLRVILVSNIKRQTKNSAFGYLWWLIDPVLLTLVYYLLFVVIFKYGGGSHQPYILFLLCGLLSWKAFADTANQSVMAIRGQASIVKAIGFPKAVLPLSSVFSNMVFFLFGWVVMMLVAWASGLAPNVYYLFLPLVMGLQILFTVGVSLIIATLGVFFRDTGNILGHIMRIWYFLSPGVYSIDRIPEHLRPWFRLNPFAELMTCYRDILWGIQPALMDMLMALGIGIGSCLLGFLLFRHFESRLVHRL